MITAIFLLSQYRSAKKMNLWESYKYTAWVIFVGEIVLYGGLMLGYES